MLLMPFLLDISNSFLLNQNILKIPGHDHHLNFVYQPGDLNMESAIYNWFCPVEEGDSEDITIIFRRQVSSLLFFFLFILFLTSSFFIFLRLFSFFNQTLY